MTSVRTTCKTAVAILALGVLVVAASVGTRPASAAAGEPVLEDVLQYAEDEGISVVEAVRQFGVMEAVGYAAPAFEAALGDRFGGVFIEHDPDFLVVIQSTERTDATAVQGLATSLGIGPDWAFRVVQYDIKTLRANAQEIASRLAGRADVWSSTRENSVEVMVRDLDDVDFALPATARTRVVPMLGKPAANIYGATQLYSGSSPHCTNGFTIYGWDGGVKKPGVLTAGHCDDNLNANGVNLTLIEEKHFGKYDVQWHRIGALTPKNQIIIGPQQYRTINGFYAANQVVGDYTCKMGRITQYDCGYIDNDGFCATWIPNWNCTYIMLRNNSVDMASPGDSGGPIFKNDKGWGITSGSTWNIAQFCECNNVYTPIEYAQGGLNVTPFKP